MKEKEYKLTELGKQLLNAEQDSFTDEEFEQFKKDNDIELAKQQAEEDYELE